MNSKKPSKADAALNKEIERLKQLFETSSIYYQCLNSEGKLIEVNTSWLKLLGYNSNEVIGKWFGDFLTKDSGSRFTTSFSSISKASDSCSMELTLICKDGSSIYCEFSCSANFDSKDQLTTTYCIFSNITRLRMAEQALYESEKKYSRLVELSNVGIYELDPFSGEFTYVNDVIKKTFKLDDKNGESFRVDDFLYDKEKDRYFDRLKELSQGTEISKRSEYRLKKPDGDDMWVQITNSRVLTHEGTLRIIGVAQDITERKQMEMELRSYYNRLEQITSNLPSVVFQYTYNNGFTEFQYISENIAQFIGYSANEIKKEPALLNSLINPADYDRLVKKVDDSIKDASPARIRYKVKRKDGSTRIIETILSQKLLENGVELFTGISSDLTEEVELKAKLLQTENKYESIVKSALTAISIMSKQGIITSVNPRLCEISGYSEDELVGKSFLKIPAFYAKNLKKYIELYKNALKGNIPNEPVSFEWKHKSGERRWGEAYLSAVKDNGKIIAYQAVLIDITSRVLLKKQEKERSKEQNFLFESAFSLLSIQDEYSLFEFLADRVHKLIPSSIAIVNSISEDFSQLTIESIRTGSKAKYAKAIQIFGKSIVGTTFRVTESAFKYVITGRLTVHNQNLYDLTLKQVPELVCKQLEKLIKLDEIYEISLGTNEKVIGGCAILLRKGQEIKNKSVVEMLFREASEALLRIRASKKLDTSEKHYRSLAESSGDWIMRFNRSFQQVYINNAVSIYFGKNKEDLLGKSCAELGYSIEQSHLIERQLGKAFSLNESCRCEIKLDLPEKSDFFEWNFYPESLPDSERVETVLVNVRNISGRKVEEGKLLEVISAKNKLYSILSHDLRSPFNSILGFLDLLISKYDQYSEEERKLRLKRIENSTKNVYDLLDSILQWTKEYDSQESIKPVYFNLKSLINRAIEVHASTIIERQVQLHNDVSSNIIMYADFNMLFAVVRNLLSNAIKFSDNNGKVLISAIDREKEIICKIQDFGKGMKKDDLKDILNKNERLIHSDTSGRSGFGMGLKFSSELIQSNNGRIWIESEYGKGTTVYFAIPTQHE